MERGEDPCIKVEWMIGLTRVWECARQVEALLLGKVVKRQVGGE